MNATAAKEQISPFQNTTDLEDGTRIVCGAIKMEVPQAGKSVRQIFVDLPKFAARPIVSITVDCVETGNPEKTNFAVYDLTVLLQPDKTVLKISAQNLFKFVESDHDFVATYIATGKRP